MGCTRKNLIEYGLGTAHSTYVIAEIGLNHGGNLEVAKGLIDSAAKTGADAVKFQTYKTEKRVAKDSPLFDILKRCELPFEAFGELKNRAEQHGLTFFSTPFDDESVDYLESIKCNLYKIASFDVVNHTLVARIARTRKPAILSVGMAHFEEIEEAWSILRSGTDKIALLHCISAYPTREEDANLAVIAQLYERFDCVIGQSDHTNDIRVPLYAVAAGAQVIEKHFRIDETMNCIDAPVSITESQMKRMVDEIRSIEKIFGTGELGVRMAEKDTAVFRRPSRIV